jgi:hypothetical protein
MAKVNKTGRVATRSGRMLTDEMAEKLADELETDREVRWARRRPAGRPTPHGDGVTPKVSFRIPTVLVAELRVRANKERRTVSDITREALERFLAG